MIYNFVPHFNDFMNAIKENLAWTDDYAEKLIYHYEKKKRKSLENLPSWTQMSK